MNTFCNKLKLYIIVLLLASSSVFAQNTFMNDNNTTNTGLNTDLLSDGTNLEAGTLPSGFNGINLGMDTESVIELLKKDFLFAYVDQVFRTTSPYDKQIYTVEGRNFIDHAYFYFSQEDKLISMSLFLNEKYIDYGVMYENLRTKYGRPAMNPSQARWSDSNITIRLEKPLSIKYTLESDIPSNNSTSRSEIEIDRDDFLRYF